MILLEDTLTGTERTWLSLYDITPVLVRHQIIQAALEPSVRALIERALGRRTRAAVTGLDRHSGIAVHPLTLEEAEGAPAQ